MWYLIGFLVTWVGASWWMVNRANDTEIVEIIETVGIALLLSLIWPISLMASGIAYGLFVLVNHKNRKDKNAHL